MGSFSIAGKTWLEVACKKSTKDDALIHQVFFLVCLRLLLSCICCGPSVGVRRRLDPFQDLASFVPQIGCGSKQLWSWRGGPSLCWFLWSLSGSQNLQSGLSFPQRKKSGQQLFLQSLVSEFFLWGMLKTERKPQKTKLRLKASASFQDLLLKICVLHI